MAKNTILFIDELHTLVGAGSAEGAIDASNVLKPALARGEIQCIGATTLDEYRKYIEKDGALERRFQTIIVEPPSKSGGAGDPQGPPRPVRVAPPRADHRRGPRGRRSSSPTATSPAAACRTRPSTSMDEAGARVRLKAMTRPPDLKEIDDQIERLNQEKEEAVANQDFEKAAAAARPGRQAQEEERNDQSRLA